VARDVGTETHVRSSAGAETAVVHRREEAIAVIDVDARSAQEFGARMLGTVNGAMLTLGISLGHRTGLYDALSELAPATSTEIAEHAGLHERSVREWLAGQLAGGIVGHDPEAGTWWLPPEHALSLTRTGVRTGV
jgi:hypothetical protein